MIRDDNFSNATKDQLAKRAGYRCSFVGCGAPTFGPSEEKETSTVGSGMACHISAASAGPSARRYIKVMSSEARKDISNGIWMCYTHGKIIDADEKRFSIEILKKWNEIAEGIAKIMVERNCEYKDALKSFQFSDFAVSNISINGVGGENEIIGNAMNDCCVAISWGRDLSNVTRDFIIEHIRNAFLHGKATNISFESKNNKLIITDNGNEFNPKNLISVNKNSGGVISVKELMNKFSSKLILSTQRKENLNVTTIAKLKNQDDILEITPCSYKISFEEFRRGSIDIHINETCNELFIVLPTYISPSDIGMMNRKLLKVENELRPITFITKHLSDWVVEIIKKNHPTCQVLEVD